MTPIQKAKEIDRLIDIIWKVRSYMDGKVWSNINLHRFFDSPQAAAILSGEDWKEDGWVSVKDKPLVDWEERDGKKYWTEIGAGARGFIAAVPYRDKTQPGKSLWWIHHCIIEETGLHIVGEDDNEPAGWNIEDVTHYVPIPSLMTISRTP